MLLRCVGPKQAVLVMAEVHEGIDGAHQAGPRMRWLIHKHGFYWPSMEKDCIEYAKGCQACQKHGPIQQKVSSRTRSRRHLSFIYFFNCSRNSNRSGRGSRGSIQFYIRRGFGTSRKKSCPLTQVCFFFLAKKPLGCTPAIRSLNCDGHNATKKEGRFLRRLWLNIYTGSTVYYALYTFTP